MSLSISASLSVKSPNYFFGVPKNAENLTPVSHWSNSYAMSLQIKDSCHQLGQGWGSFLGGVAPVSFGDEARPGNFEIGRNQDFDGGNKSIQVDGQGNVVVNQAGRFDGLVGAFAGMDGCGNHSSGMAVAGKLTSAKQLRFENGNILLPNGKSIPFGNVGVVVVMPDGSQVGVGRNSANSTEQIRTAYAGPGQEVPVSPPGATNVFYLNEAGDIVNRSVK